MSCQVFCREAAEVMRRSPHQVGVEFLPKGLHELPATLMRERIQAAVDHAATSSPPPDAVLLGYGLCSHALSGIEARFRPVVIPRAHDCLTLLLGGRERYQGRFDREPATYFQSSGWVEHRLNPPALEAQSIPTLQRLRMSYEERAARYGRENALYLEAELGNPARHYRHMAFIDLGLEPAGVTENASREEARRRGWSFERITGDLRLLQRLVDGDWELDFVVLQPGERSVATNDERILASRPISS